MLIPALRACVPVVFLTLLERPVRGIWFPGNSFHWLIQRALFFRKLQTDRPTDRPSRRPPLLITVSTPQDARSGCSGYGTQRLRTWGGTARTTLAVHWFLFFVFRPGEVEVVCLSTGAQGKFPSARVLCSAEIPRVPVIHWLLPELLCAATPPASGLLRARTRGVAELREPRQEIQIVDGVSPASSKRGQSLSPLEPGEPDSCCTLSQDVSSSRFAEDRQQKKERLIQYFAGENFFFFLASVSNKEENSLGDS